MATLSKFGVPLGGQRFGPLLAPKTKYHFAVRFFNFGSNGNTATPITFNTNTAQKPTIQHEEVVVHSYNSRQYYAGKHEWNPVTITTRDTVDSDVIFNIGSQLQRQFDHYNQTGLRAATSYKFTTFIETLDGGNDLILDRWILEGCFLTQVNYGDLDYSSSDNQVVEMSLRYDNATNETGDGTTLMQSPSADPLGNTL